MLVLGLQGSPRRKGNTHHLLSLFLQAASAHGAETLMVPVDKKNILACKEYVVCEKKGYCPIEDDMPAEIYPLLRQADAVVMASPVFFYGVTAQLKALIDRCQVLWAKKYKFKLADPGAGMRRGFILAVGATRGANLFEGIELTGRYFFDGIDARYHGSLNYRGIEGPKDMKRHPTVEPEVASAVADLMQPFESRKKVVFACRKNAFYSQIAGAFARHMAGDRLDVTTGGTQPADDVPPQLAVLMAEKGLDTSFCVPRTIDRVVEGTPPDYIVTMGCGEAFPGARASTAVDWDVPPGDPASPEKMRQIRDEIERRVIRFIDEI